MKLTDLLRGKYVAIDGVDGAGKTTMTGRLVRELRDSNIEAARLAGVPIDLTFAGVEVVREPGGTAVGELLRGVLLESRASMTQETELLLFMAARAQLVRERVKPVLGTGMTVVSDRCAASSFAYQCSGPERLSFKMVYDAYGVAVPPSLRPDLIVVLDLPVAAARTRISASGRATTDRFEKRDDAFFAEVADTYRSFVTSEHNAWLVDASRSPEVTFENVKTAIVKHFTSRGSSNYVRKVG